MKTGLKDPGDIKSAANYAHKCRTAPANTMSMPPPDGPNPEPVRLNGVPMIKEKGTSK